MDYERTVQVGVFLGIVGTIVWFFYMSTFGYARMLLFKDTGLENADWFINLFLISFTPTTIFFINKKIYKINNWEATIGVFISSAIMIFVGVSDKTEGFISLKGFKDIGIYQVIFHLVELFIREKVKNLKL